MQFNFQSLQIQIFNLTPIQPEKKYRQIFMTIVISIDIHEKLEEILLIWLIKRLVYLFFYNREVIKGCPNFGHWIDLSEGDLSGWSKHT